jgi:hypothetical protein
LFIVTGVTGRSFLPTGVAPDLLDDIEALDHGAEDGVLPVEVRRRDRA